MLRIVDVPKLLDRKNLKGETWFNGSLSLSLWREKKFKPRVLCSREFFAPATRKKAITNVRSSASSERRQRHWHWKLSLFVELFLPLSFCVCAFLRNGSFDFVFLSFWFGSFLFSVFELINFWFPFSDLQPSVFDFQIFVFDYSVFDSLFQHFDLLNLYFSNFAWFVKSIFICLRLFHLLDFDFRLLWFHVLFSDSPSRFHSFRFFIGTLVYEIWGLPIFGFL